MQPILMKSLLVCRVGGLLSGYGWNNPMHGVTIGPIIFHDGTLKRNSVAYTHESIHVAQWLELLIFGFIVIYCFDFCSGIARGMTAQEAYKNIRLEQEAYDCQNNTFYLLVRPSFAWTQWSLDPKKPSPGEDGSDS